MQIIIFKRKLKVCELSINLEFNSALIKKQKKDQAFMDVIKSNNMNGFKILIGKAYKKKE